MERKGKERKGKERKGKEAPICRPTRQFDSIYGFTDERQSTEMMTDGA